MHRATRLAACAAATATVAAAVALVTAVPSGAATPYTANGSLRRALVGFGVTDSEFTQTCPTLPATQGEDGWVFDLPPAVAISGTNVSIAGTPATHVLHAFVYNANCSFIREIDGTAGNALQATLNPGERFLSVYTTTASLVTVNLALTATPPDTPTPSPTATPSPTPTFTPAPRGTYPLTPNDPLFLQDGDADPFFAGQWGMRTIHAPQAWQEPRATGAGIKVAVIDSGLDLTHADFACPGKVQVVANSDPDPDGKDLPIDDVEGHGTHVAGIIGACTQNGTGVVGVAPDSTIMPIQTLSPTITPTDSVATVAGAIDTAVANGAHVINMSIGFGTTGHVGTAAFLTSTSYAPIEEAIERAVAAGVVVVSAAGNDTSPLCGFPAIAEDVVCVGASDRRDLNSWYGNFPVKLDSNGDAGPALLAPGGAGEPVLCDFSAQDIISTYAVSVDRAEGDCDALEGYATIEGTSMASPHVAGVAALVYDRIGGTPSAANGAKVVEALLNSAVDLYGPGYDPASGYGRVDALAAVRYFAAAPEPTPTPAALPTSLALTAPGAGQYSDTVALEARLTTTGGNAIGGEPLTFQLLGHDGFREVAATTDANGTARATLTLDAPPGAYDVIAGYAGKQDTWQTSSAHRAFTIDREDTRTTLAVSGSGAKRTLTATLTDADDATHRIPNATVAFYADGAKIGEAVTDDNGTATFTPPAGARGSGTAYQARFAGTALYLPSAS